MEGNGCNFALPFSDISTTTNSSKKGFSILVRSGMTRIRLDLTVQIPQQIFQGKHKTPIHQGSIKICICPTSAYVQCCCRPRASGEDYVPYEADLFGRIYRQNHNAAQANFADVEQEISAFLRFGIS